jgi:uncharacterized protein YndB with AHSA1/START domain
MAEKKLGGSTMSKTEYVIEPGKQEILITRMFDAPRELVFKAFTDPNLMAQWWGPRDLSTRIEKFEARPGGEWRFVQRDAAGNEFRFHGVHHDVVAPERIVTTFEFEGAPGHVLLQCATFESIGDKPKLVTQSIYQSVADRDGMVAAGMKRGSDDSMDRLSELVETMKAGRA